MALQAGVTEEAFSVEPERLPDAPMFTGDASAWPLVIGAFILSAWVLVGIGKSPLSITLFVLLVGAIILEMALYRKRNRNQIQAKVVEWRRSQVAEYEKRAQQLTQQVGTLRRGFYVGLASLPELLNKAGAYLSHAEREFDERAYVPFWDYIEQAALSLASFKSTLTGIDALAQSYTRSLSGRTHNFPPLAIQPSDLPDPSPQTERLRHLVRIGHRDFEFASMWAQRKTQSVIMDGLRSLSETIDTLDWSFNNSLSGVSKAIEEGFSGAREEQIRFREYFEGAVKKWEEQNGSMRRN